MDDLGVPLVLETPNWTISGFLVCVKEHAYLIPVRWNVSLCPCAGTSGGAPVFAALASQTSMRNAYGKWTVSSINTVRMLLLSLCAFLWGG